MKINWKVKLGLLLLVTSINSCFHLFNFHDLEKVIFYIVVHLTFMLLDIFIVIIIEGLIDRKKKKSILEKLDMIMSAFFSEMGTDFLVKFSALDHNTLHIK